MVPLRELLDQLGDAADEEVVAEVHDEVVVAEEILGDEHAVGQAERCFLRDVGDLDAELGAVAEAASISAAVSPTMIPTSVMPASRIASRP